MNALLLALLPLASLAQTCPDRADILRTMEDAAGFGDAAATATHSDGLVAAMACGSSAEPELLTRFWLAEGVAAHYGEAPDDAADAFRAAHRILPGYFRADYGGALLDVYTAAAKDDATSTGTISLERDAGSWTVVVDGALLDIPAELTQGLHLVQVGFDKRSIWHAGIVYVTAGADTVVDLPPPPERPGPPPFRLHVGAGGSVFSGDKALGPVRSISDAVEPETKVLLGTELGMEWQQDRAWVRAYLHGGVLASGAFLFQRNDVGGSSPFAGGLGVATGGTIGPLRVGALGAAQLPGRVPLRAVFAVGHYTHAIEARVGGNLATSRPVEAGAEVFYVFRPQLGK